MQIPSKTHFLLLILALVFLLSAPGCSDDSDPTEPAGDPPQGNTPPLPTVDNPTDQLPATSETLQVEEALLGNFSPKTMGPCGLVDALNAKAIALEFRMVPGYCRLLADDEPALPGNLQWATYGYENGSDCVPSPSPPLFNYLDSREGSYYYGLDPKAYWMVHDLNARLAGGDLVTIGSATENDFVHDLRQAWMPGEYITIGFYDWGRANGDFVWRSGEPVTFTGWVGEEPNNSGGEYFTHMSTTGGWNDINGAQPLYGMVETDQRLPDPGADQVPVLLLGASPLYLGDLGQITDRPYVVRSVYWKKVFQKTLGAGTTYSQSHSYTYGTEETSITSFGYSIGISTELGWGPVSTEISMEFSQDFSHEMSVYREDTYSDVYECTAPAGKTVIFALWHLVEEFTICNEAGEPWTDPNYTLDGPLPTLVQGLDQEYLQTLYFDQ